MRMLLLFSLLSLIVNAAFAAPQAANAAPDPQPSILTSFKFAGCSDDQTKILNENVNILPLLLLSLSWDILVVANAIPG